MRGAVASRHLPLLRKAGANALIVPARILPEPSQVASLLNRASELQLRAGIPIRIDPGALTATEFDRTRREALQTIRRYQGNSATLFWLIQPTTGTWRWQESLTAERLHELAEAIRERDPQHPVILQLKEDEIEAITSSVPRLQTFDALGIAFAGLPEEPIQPRLLAAGWTKPYLIAAFGPAAWQSRFDDNGRIDAPPSNRVAEEFAGILERELADKPGLLGGFLANWSADTDGTLTYGVPFLENEATFALFDRLQQAWTGHVASRTPPGAESLVLEPGSLLAPGSQVDARITGLEDTTDLRIEWILTSDAATPELTEYQPEIISRRQTRIPRIVYGLPYAVGPYRLHAIVTDVRRKAAAVSVPITVRGGEQN